MVSTSLVQRVVDARIDERILELQQPVLRVSVQEAGRRLGLSRTLTFQRIAQGRLRAVRDGRRTLVHVDEIARYAREEGDPT
jgi:excisionase family DNA binding protein